MAIVQISRITNRKGLAENLPQLAGAELGWSVDTRQLWIGNGTLEEGAPVIGNTEILTEFSDITPLLDYTYRDVVVGYAAQTGPTSSDPIVRSVQEKLDDFADVRDFGAVGDGVTDDTDAINRALYQLYCRETNTQIRRTLYFPAGTYLVTETIIIPTYAKLVGEGADCTIITMDSSSLDPYVARYGDSLQQVGGNIGNNDATPPTHIEINSMSFKSDVVNDVFLVDQASNCWFQNVDFVGSYSQTQITNSGATPLSDVACIRFNSTVNNTVDNIVFDACSFSYSATGIKTNETIKAVTVTNGKFDWLSKGVSLSGGTLTGFRTVHNQFDNIYSEGIVYDDVNINISAYNVFYNVGNSIGSSSPVTPCIVFGNDTNVSVNDLFERIDADAYTVPRIQITTSSTVSGGTQLQMGRYTRETGRTFTLENNQSNVEIFSTNNDYTKAFQMFYTITRLTSVRNGTLTVVSGPDDSTGALDFSDDYVQNDDTGITLEVTQSGSQTIVQYDSTNIGSSGTLTYSISHLA